MTSESWKYIVWSRHSEATREKQELPIEIQRTTFKRTHVNNINFKSNKHKRNTLNNKKNDKRLHCKSKRIKTKQHSNTYTSHLLSSYKHKGYGSCMTTIVWSRHSEAKREKQEFPMEIRRTTFKRTHTHTSTT